MTEIFSLRSEGSLVKGQKPKFEYLKILDRNFLGPGCEPKPKPKTKNQFRINSIQFWYRNRQTFKIQNPILTVRFKVLE